MAEATKKDIKETCGSQQLACGVKAGIEGAVHAVEELFKSTKEDGHGLLLMDASNAFNALNRETALWNVRILWPRCSRFLFNTYRGYAPLIFAGTTELLFSCEGTTQGDPLAMLFYGVSLMPLIESLKDRDKYLQTWYADDSGALGALENLVEWLSSLTENGPKYGYYPEPSKSYFVVHPNFVEKAHQLFDRFGIRIVEGRRYLGGLIGSDEGKNRFILKKGPRIVGLSWRVVQRGRKRTSSCFSWINKIPAMRMEFCPESSQRYVAVVCSSQEDVGGKLFAKLTRNF